MSSITKEGISSLTSEDLIIRISSLIGSEKGSEAMRFLRNLKQARELFDAFQHEDNYRQTAVFVSQELDITRVTIYRKIKELRLKPDDFKQASGFLDLVNRSPYLRKGAINLEDIILNSHEKKR